MRRLAIVFILCFLLIAVLVGRKPQVKGADTILRGMTLEEKIGALFMVRPEALGELTAPGPNLGANHRQYPVSGVVFFAKNLQNPSQVTSYIAELQSVSSLPLLIGVDQEGGTISRFSAAQFDMPVLPSMYSIGQGRDPAKAYDALLDTGRSLKALGFNVDFAPVADIWSNPDNKVIGDRAFSNTAVGAAPFVTQAVLGLEEAGIASCVKHFPGHGDTATDSHDDAAVSNVDTKTLHQRELTPFIAGIEAGCPMAMIGHIKLPKITDDDLPASLSPEIVDGLLRDELGFDGVVVTDAMDMGAVANFYAPEEAAIMAIRAGCDILLMPESLPKAFSAVKSAVDSGTISEERINESVLRIIKMRIRYGGEKNR